MAELILWYFALSLLGLATFPLAYFLLPGLADRGYAFSRALGLLVWGYAYWMLGSLGVLRNDPGGLVFALIVLLALSGWAATRIGVDGFLEWWARQRGAVLVAELLFLAAFVGMAYLRGKNPDLASTEKPMELMFITSILRSPAFPPHDSWLAGYAISYYYFGYVKTAMLAMLTSVSAPVAFSLMLATVFALGGMGAWGVAYNLLEAVRQRGAEEQRSREEKEVRNTQYGLRNAFFALLAPLFVLVVSNVEGFLEVLHARGIGWGDGQGRFWQWLDLKDLASPPAAPPSWMPSRFLWWWRASRVVNDVDYAGRPIEVIDEFPFFSFLLGDLHPHVLAIPFAFLAIGLALNLFLSTEPGAVHLFGFRLRLSKITFGLAALALGGLAFLNTWDFPIYLALFAGAYTLRRAEAEGWSWMRLADFAGLGAALGVAGVVLYLPFYIGFSSQAGGILPNVLNPTRGAHLWVMFGTLFVPLFLFLAFQVRSRAGNVRVGFLLGLGCAAALFVFALLLVGAAALTPEGAGAVSLLGAPDAGAFLREALARRVVGAGGWGTLVILLGLAAGSLVQKDDADAQPFSSGRGDAPARFAVLLILTGGLLVLGPEFVYLRDQFGTRMNTVFKFYYQAWLLWGTAAGFGAAFLLQALGGAKRAGLATLIVLCAGLGLVYPVLSVQTRTNGFSQPWTLDGTGSSYLRGGDVAAVEWLKTAPIGTLVEAVGGSYSGFGRIASHSGMPSLINWPGHQSQWRGGGEEMGTRMADVETIYRSGSWAETEALLEKYDVRYVYVGDLERGTYPVNEAKFRRFLRVVYEAGGVVIYEYQGQ